MAHVVISQVHDFDASYTSTAVAIAFSWSRFTAVATLRNEAMHNKTRGRFFRKKVFALNLTTEHLSS